MAGAIDIPHPSKRHEGWGPQLLFSRCWQGGCFFLQQLLHRMAYCRDGLFCRRSEKFGVQIGSTLAPRLRNLHRNAMRVGPRVLADPGYLP